MDAKQVDEAFESLARYCTFLWHDERDGTSEADQFKTELARILNREPGTGVVPEDDGEPTTKDWLESIGFVSEHGRFARGQLQFTYFAGWNAWWAVKGQPHVSSRLVDGLNTRGHVRRLLAALSLAPEAGPT